ncbi:MAG TPA: nuclear transport factor 2 family protein [Hyphomicrobiaceae bacterium]|nr:nuclear transport factor 2 family protein [Hyphomicrobiaceae bacterium]
MSDVIVRELIDREAIKELKARYCRFVDQQQWERLRGLFAPDTRFDGFNSAPAGSTVDQFIAGISARFVGVVSIHHVHSPEIAFTGSNSARGIWPMMDYLQFPPTAVMKEAPGMRGFVGYGHYEEEYVRTAEGWRFSLLRLTRIRIDPLGPDLPPVQRGMLMADPSWL